MIRLELTLPHLPAAQVQTFKLLSAAMDDLGVKTPLKNTFEQEVVATTSTGGTVWMTIQKNADYPNVREVAIQVTGRGLSPFLHTILDAAIRGEIPWVNITSPDSQ